MPILAQAELDHCFPPAHDHPGKNSGFPGRASGDGVSSQFCSGRWERAHLPDRPGCVNRDAPTEVPKPIAVSKKNC